MDRENPSIGLVEQSVLRTWVHRLWIVVSLRKQICQVLSGHWTQLPLFTTAALVLHILNWITAPFTMMSDKDGNVFVAVLVIQSLLLVVATVLYLLFRICRTSKLDWHSQVGRLLETHTQFTAPLLCLFFFQLLQLAIFFLFFECFAPTTPKRQLFCCCFVSNAVVVHFDLIIPLTIHRLLKRLSWFYGVWGGLIWSSSFGRLKTLLFWLLIATSS